jgi:hypothetical protein
MIRNLAFLEEPLLEFGHRQKATNPKTGLYFYGPVDDRSRPQHIKIGVVATSDGHKLYRAWSDAINMYIDAPPPISPNHLPFPGLNATFAASVNRQPELHIEISQTQLARAIRSGKRHEAVREAVTIYEQAIRRGLDDDGSVDVWFVVIPDEIYRYGRPKSVVPKSEALGTRLKISRKRAAEILAGSPSLFPEENAEAAVFLFEPNFHHQLKARLLDVQGVVIQIVRESTLHALSRQTATLEHQRRLQDPASIAWNITTTLFYKAGGHPWKLANVRDRVCYIGLVFKLFPDSSSGRRACCGAQMFLDDGEGLVFRGTPGDWYDPKTRQFHLSESEAQKLIEGVVSAYKQRNGDNHAPNEIFIHGRTRFNAMELNGFRKGAPDTEVTTVRISDGTDMRLYAPRDTPVLRGTAMQVGDRHGYLWTKGFVAELGTYPGREVPRPLAIEVVSGESALSTVMSDVLTLTKLNFNSCVFADGIPVTLRFADAVGEIITALPEEKSMPAHAPLPFKRYI